MTSAKTSSYSWEPVLLLKQTNKNRVPPYSNLSNLENLEGDQPRWPGSGRLWTLFLWGVGTIFWANIQFFFVLAGQLATSKAHFMWGGGGWFGATSW